MGILEFETYSMQELASSDLRAEQRAPVHWT